MHRCYQRHGISRLPNREDSPDKKPFKAYPIGYFHLDIAEVHTEEGKLYLFVAIDRTSKFAYAELHPGSDRMVAIAFLQALLKAVPSKIHTILTDNGGQFCHAPRISLIASAANMRSNIASRNRTILGPMGKSNA